MPAPHFIQANTNGRLHAATEPSLSPLDRGFLYGDAIYEVWRTYHATLFAWEEHWSRLEQSARALHMPLAWTPARILSEIRRTVVAYRATSGFGGELYVRLQISRGAGSIGLDTGLAGEPSFVLLVQPCPSIPDAVLARGQRLSLASGLRRNPAESLNPAWKTGNYLNNILGLREARARGADEVLLLNLAGEITEAAVSNVAFFRDNVLVTPPLSAGILAGITRGLLLGSIAPAAGIRISEEPVRPSDLDRMDECLLMSSTKDIVPVGAIDGQNYPVGPGTATAGLKAKFAEYAKLYSDSHPELKV